MAQDNLFQLLLVKFNELQKKHDSLSELFVNLSAKFHKFKDSTDITLDRHSTDFFTMEHRIHLLSIAKSHNKSVTFNPGTLPSQQVTQTLLSTHTAEIKRIDQDLSEVKAKILSSENNQKTSTKQFLSLQQLTQNFPANTSRPPPFFRHNFSKQRQIRPRLCYNCRQPGHMAKDCQRPNPRNQNLSAPTTSTTTALSEPNSPTLSESPPPPAKTMSLASQFAVLQIPVFSKNPLLHGVNLANLIYTPFGSESDW